MKKYNFKKFLYVTLLLIFIVSCNKNNKVENNTKGVNNNMIEVSNSNITLITVDEFLNKFKSEENFSFVVTKQSCGMCKDLYSILNSHIDIKIDYEIKLDNLDKNYKDDLKKLKEILPNLMVAPDLNFKKGNTIYRFDEEYSDINYENLSSWIIKCKNND